jgi:hypothetical protein
MPSVTVVPETFSYTTFDASEIARLTERVVGIVGLDCDVTVEVDDSTPAIITSLERWDPDVVLKLAGGSIEDPKRIRRLGEDAALEVLGRLLFRAVDRRSPAFADAPAEAALDVRRHACWEVYAVARGVRAGLPGSESRRRYQLRNRHGFSDAVDATFDRLWTADSLTWSDIVALSDAAAASTLS